MSDKYDIYKTAWLALREGLTETIKTASEANDVESYLKLFSELQLFARIEENATTDKVIDFEKCIKKYFDLVSKMYLDPLTPPDVKASLAELYQGLNLTIIAAEMDVEDPETGEPQ